MSFGFFLTKWRWIAALLPVFPALPAKAVLFQPLSIQALAMKADVVAHGTVLSRTCLRDANGRIYTRVELKIAEIWKGAVSGSPLLIYQGGGVLGEEQATVSGQVTYDVGEEVVAFLVRNSRGEAVTLGLMQGKFHVWKDAVTGTLRAASPFHAESRTAAAQASSLRTASFGPAVAPLTLAELERRVREALP